MASLYDRILVPLDGSDAAQQALPYAVQLATQSGAELVLMRVVPDLKAQVNVKNNMPFVLLKTEEQHQLVDDATRWLDHLVVDLALHNLKADAVVDVGDPAQKIVETARAGGVDMIVMSTHGRTGLARLAYGSVAAKVMAESSCPVLLVRSLTAVTGTSRTAVSQRDEVIA